MQLSDMNMPMMGNRLKDLSGGKIYQPTGSARILVWIKVICPEFSTGKHNIRWRS